MKSSGGVCVAGACGMYSKFSRHATCAVAVLFAVACSSVLPWHNEPIGGEVNLAFTVKNNLLYLASATIDGHEGRFIFGSAEPRTVLDAKFAQTVDGAAHSLHLNARKTVPVAPVIADLGGIGDGIVGADVWAGHAVTIDYRAGLLTFQQEGMHSELMTVYKYADAPMINVIIDGRSTPTVVDTASPDTLVLPRLDATGNRRAARVQIAGTDFGSVDVRLADVSAPRVGNRLLSRFLVSIDYGRRQVGLWRDPRIAL
jgi:hypothetical protein